MKRPKIILADIIVGGQAVLEGVMMRSPNAYAVSVRRSDGSIVSKSARVPRLSDKYPLLGLPVVRGAATLFQTLALGIKALNFSGEVALQEEEEAEEVEVRGAATAGAAADAVSVTVPKETESGGSGTIWGSLAFALVVNLGLFIFIPLVATNALFMAFGYGPAAPEVASDATLFETGRAWGGAMIHSIDPTFSFNLVEGAIRMAIFLTMIFSMSRLPDIHRVFEYHGAEHKVVAAYESGAGLTVEAARPQRRQHPRCGTSFLMVVMLVAIVLFSIVSFETFLGNAAARIALLPIVAGLSYEVIRAAARKQSSLLFRAMVLPGLWLQNITTQEPDDSQLEVAIHALETSLALEPGGH